MCHLSGFYLNDTRFAHSLNERRCQDESFENKKH